MKLLNMNNNYFVVYAILVNIVIKKIIIKLKKIFNIDNNMNNNIICIIISSLISSLLIILFINIYYNITFTEYKNINNWNISLIVNKIDFDKNFDKIFNNLNGIGLITNFII